MRPGPLPNTIAAQADVSFVEKCDLAWGVPPEWVAELAAYTDIHGLRKTASNIGYSASVISTVIGNKYGGDMRRVEAKVRGAVMGEMVSCPVLDQMARHLCLDWQRKPFAATSSLRVQMYHACRSACPYSRIQKVKEHE